MGVKIRSEGKTLTDIPIKCPSSAKKEDKSKSNESFQDSITEQREKTINASKREGVLKNIKAGVSQNFAVPFGLAIGMSPTIVTFLTSIPQLVGAFLGLFTERIIEFLKRRKIVMVYASYIESLTWVIIMLMAFLAIKSPILLIIFVTLDIVVGNIISPIWTAIISDTVPGDKLGKFLGVRSILTGIANLGSMILAGLILNWFAGVNELIGFAVIFGIAAITAFLGARYQAKMIDPNPVAKKRSEVSKYSFREFILTIRENNFGMFTTFYALFQLVVNIVSPFYAIYMLKVLKFNYLVFTIITLASVVSALLSMHLWGKLTDKYGSKRIFSITSFLIVVSPLLWMTTTNWMILATIEFCSGIMWAGFNLSCSAFMFESVKPEYKVKFYAYNKVVLGVGIFLGVLIGTLIYNLPPFLFSSTILWLLFVSGTLRFVVAIIFIPLIQEEKVVTINFKEGRFHKHFITLRPRHGHSVEIFENKEHGKNIVAAVSPEKKEKRGDGKEIAGKGEKEESRKEMKPKIPPRAPPRIISSNTNNKTPQNNKPTTQNNKNTSTKATPTIPDSIRNEAINRSLKK